MHSNIIFRQLFDEKTWTYTYILGDIETRKAIIIDPVRDQLNRDIQLLTELNLELIFILDTHIHADHITGSGLLREKTGAKIVMGK
jgi:sulfur dioxygenase